MKFLGPSLPFLVLWLILACSTNSTPAREFSGQDLANRLGCFACHRDGGAPPLEGSSARLSPQELRQVLTYPRTIRPGVKMPSYAYLPPQEQQALMDFLLSGK